MAKTKNTRKSPAKKTLMTFASHKISGFSRFFVEESTDNVRWHRIPEGAGPYASSETAIGVAHAYSLAHHVWTRVVGVS